MTEADLLDLRLASDVRELAGVRKKLRRLCDERGWAADRTAELILAVDEAITNVIRHGYDGASDRKILVKVRAIRDPEAGDGFQIVVRDFGKQVALESIRGRDLDQPRPGGLGVHIIRGMTDFAEYAHAEGGGIQLTLRKYKKARDESEERDVGT